MLKPPSDILDLLYRAAILLVLTLTIVAAALSMSLSVFVLMSIIKRILQ